MSLFKKATVATSLLLASASLSVAQDSQPATEAAVDPAEEVGTQLNYVLGYQIGEQLTQLGMDYKTKDFQEGLQAGLGGEEMKLTDQQMMQLQQSVQQMVQAKQAKAGEENKLAAAAYLAENKNRPGVQETESGLQYVVEEEGEGESPTASSDVVVHYSGTLLDGTEFDSSYSRGEPAEFNAGRVIPGWTEGLQLMKPGAKYKFFIPPELAYGPQGSPPRIEPNSALIFEVELIEVK